jgi:hypothetical protein
VAVTVARQRCRCGFSWTPRVAEADGRGWCCPQCKAWTATGQREVRPSVHRSLALGTVLDDPCPECGGELVLRESQHGRFYGCRSWPKCTGTHGAHEDGTPLGTPADRRTKLYRQAAHAVFDLLWRSGRLTRSEAYAWMARSMGLTREEAHIARFTAYQCRWLVLAVLEEFGPVEDGPVASVASVDPVTAWFGGSPDGSHLVDHLEIHDQWAEEER